MKPARLRSRVTYANLTSTLALTLALSTGGAYAVATIGAGDIKDDAVRTRHIADGQVTKTDLKDGAVTRAKLAPRARTNIVEYRVVGAHNFAADSQVCVSTSGLTRSQVKNSVWTAQLNDAFDGGGATPDDILYPVPGAGEYGVSQYRVWVITGVFNTACVERLSGPGETYDSVRIIRTVPTEVLAATAE